MLQEGDSFEVQSGGQRLRVSWHCGPAAPEGRAHGSAGICLTDASVVLVSAGGTSWDFPARRPEGTESWEQTLRREMLEEACAVVTDARLLGFARGECLEGPERGLVLVRSIWLAQVRLLEWKPEFEIRYRRLVPVAEALQQVTAPTFARIWLRAFSQAGLL